MINISEFITGVKEKYPAQLLKGRIEYEGNVISCFFKDMLLLDDTTFDLGKGTKMELIFHC